MTMEILYVGTEEEMDEAALADLQAWIGLPTFAALCSDLEDIEADQAVEKIPGIFLAVEFFLGVSGRPVAAAVRKYAPTACAKAVELLKSKSN